MPVAPIVAPRDQLSQFRPLAVLGVGMVSVAGVRAVDHVFALRARVVTPGVTPFVNADDEPVAVMACPWIPGSVPMFDRLAAMAEIAGREAIGDLAPELGGRLSLALVTREPGTDLPDMERAALQSQLRRALGAQECPLYEGAAGCFTALCDASRKLAAGQATAVCVIGADSHISIEALTLDLDRGRTIWRPRELPPGEGAGAVLVTDAAAAGRIGKRIATVLASVTAPDGPRDDNDEIVEAKALTLLLRLLPNAGALPMVTGPADVDALRRREWDLAMNRTARRLCAPYARLSVQAEIGRVGAASGVMHVAHGVSALAHRAVHADVAPGSHFWAWDISRNGTRGAALIQGAGP